MGRHEGTEMFLGRSGRRPLHRRTSRRLSLDRCLAQTACADRKLSRPAVLCRSLRLPDPIRPQKVGLRWPVPIDNGGPHRCSAASPLVAAFCCAPFRCFLPHDFRRSSYPLPLVSAVQAYRPRFPLDEGDAEKENEGPHREESECREYPKRVITYNFVRTTFGTR